MEASVRRFHPIVLSAAAALAMIPLSQSSFRGPMAVAIMGGVDFCYRADPDVSAGAARRAVPGQAPRGVNKRGSGRQFILRWIR